MRIFWLTDTRFPEVLHSLASSRAVTKSSASGFCAKMPLMCGCWSARRIRPGCMSGGIVNGENSVTLCGRLGLVARARCNGNHAEVGFAVCLQLHFTHDEPGTDSTDAELPAEDGRVRLRSYLHVCLPY